MRLGNIFVQISYAFTLQFLAIYIISLISAHVPVPIPQRKLVVLADEFKHCSKIGTLMLLKPQSVIFLAAPVTGAYGRNFLVLKSVYV